MEFESRQFIEEVEGSDSSEEFDEEDEEETSDDEQESRESKEQLKEKVRARLKVSVSSFNLRLSMLYHFLRVSF